MFGQNPFSMVQEISLRIRLQNPPAGVDFGLQQGSGHTYDTLQKQRSAGQELVFDCTIGAQPDKDGHPRLSGKLVQGPPASRFLYITIGTSAGQWDSVWSRRLKIPLTGITADLISQLAANPATVLETRVPGTGKDGGPTCGTVKPFGGWQIASKTATGLGTEEPQNPQSTPAGNDQG